MKFTMPRRDNKHKKQRVIHKTKKHWQQLVFTDPAEEHSSVSMETIRRQAVMMSSTGLEKAVRSDPGAQVKGKSRATNEMSLPL
jgi:uncharacterized protein involved in type VI secretion and phage assembly